MTNRQLLAARAAHSVAPRLWAFAYPTRGRSLPLARFAALQLWLWLLRRELQRRDLL